MRKTVAATTLALVAGPALGQDLGSCHFPLPRDAETVLVGVYEGGLKTSVRLPSGDDDMKSVKVQVARWEMPIFLVLSSYRSVAWDLRIDKGAEIAGVLVLGYYAQAVMNLPAEVQLAFSVFENGTGHDCPRPVQYPYKDGTRELSAVRDMLDREFSRDITEFHGAYKGECLPLPCAAVTAAGASGDRPSWWSWLLGTASTPPAAHPIRASTRLLR
ncbi:MAG: hypothetical protein SFW09_04090 [Hyphomicrobiaceae bacterium]|nr:hypothetical protein [Hyphomicrobiaceae bacterium]